jgi:hypothetical protein
MEYRSLLAAAALAAAPLAGQQPGGMGHGHQPDMQGSMMHEMGPAMMKMMLYTPQHLLARKDALGLSTDQVTRLTALWESTRAAREAAETEAEAHVKELDQAASAPQPDTVALKTHFAAAHAAMGKAHWLMLAAAAQAKGVLNDAQRKKLSVWADSMHAWMQQHRQMMQPGESH